MDHTVIPDWFDHPGFVKAQDHEQPEERLSGRMRVNE